jgi:glyoxylase-like metal-dependent hydrolase (beta-lactamase superfamily II)
MTAPALPASVRVFERGWLSSNNILLQGSSGNTLIDTGYVTHAAQTLALVQNALGDQPLDLIINTHLHADHCGGNALLHQHYGATIALAAREADAVRNWDEERLSFKATGQSCARFTFARTLSPGDTIELGDLEWHILGAPGHAPHSLMLYCAAHGILMTADALWENGFGVIFPELTGHSGFAEQQAVLEGIARLKPRLVIPGHGTPFCNVEAALQRAFSRLAYLRADPLRNARHALKVLIAFKLLEVRVLSFDALHAMLREAAVMRACVAILLGSVPAATEREPAPTDPGRDALLAQLLADLERAGALVIRDQQIHAP